MEKFKRLRGKKLYFIDPVFMQENRCSSPDKGGRLSYIVDGKKVNKVLGVLQIAFFVLRSQYSAALLSQVLGFKSIYKDHPLSHQNKKTAG